MTKEGGLVKRLRKIRACPEAVGWVEREGFRTLRAAWKACPRGDWMLWYIAKVAPGADWSDERKPLVLAACACARLSLPEWEKAYPQDSRPRIAIETTERWCRGEATREEVETAARDAGAAAWAAWAAGDAAWAAARAAGTARLAECADAVRKHFPRPPRVRR